MKISVAINTYNHGPFVARAIDSVLEQQTEYPWEIVVLDDCSTDDTPRILQSYCRRFPDRIRAVLHTTNQGALSSAMELLHLASGEYVAAFDGDDYWIDPFKLQRQVDFLDAHSEFVLCAHNCVMRNEWTGTETVRPDPGVDFSPTTRDLLDFHLPSGSMVFRNGLLRSWPAKVVSAGFGDRPMAIMLSQLGRVQYFTRPMSVYRIHRGGSWSGTFVTDPYRPIPETSPEGWRLMVQFWEALNEFLEHRYDDRIQELVAGAHAEIARLSQPAS